MNRRKRSVVARITCSFAGLCLVCLPGVDAQQVVVQNDSVADLGNAAIQAGFVAGESAAAWLTSPCGGEIVAVQVAWQSFYGGVPATLGEAIRVLAGGTFPIPGNELAIIEGPMMNDGFFNEFTLPIPVAIQQDEVFVVSFQFFETPSSLGPSLVTDADGCQAGKNGILAIPPGAWYNSCALGVTGDFAIRAVVECADPLIFADGFEDGDTSAWSDTLQ